MIDLHSHTTASDGSLSPTELIKRAKSIGLKAIAITDHDTLDGLEEAAAAAKKEDIVFIPGVEIEINYPYKGEFHLLGLGINNFNGELKKALYRVQNFRKERNCKIVKLMRNNNIDISLDKLKKIAGGDIIARPHFSRFLIDNGYAKNQKQAFSSFLNPGAPYYVAKKSLDLKEAIKHIHSDGGKAIIAHPQSLYLSWGKIQSVFHEYKNLGLDGIEAWHGGISKKDCTRFEKIASDLRLIVSGGSDYHGDNIQGRTLGVGAGDREIPDILLPNFI